MLEIQFQRQLQLPGRVEKIAAAGQFAKILVLQDQVSRPKTNPVKNVESFGAKLQADRLPNWEIACDGHVFVQVRKLSDLRVVTCGVAEAVEGSGCRTLIRKRTRAARSGAAIGDKEAVD